MPPTTTRLPSLSSLVPLGTQRRREVSEFKTTTTKNRGFYFINMKLVQSGGRQEKKKKRFLYKYFKWVLWVSLFLYFFTSYLITSSSNKYIFPLKPTISSPKTTSHSRALFQINTTVLQKTRHKASIFPQGKFNDLKVYIYDLPSKYNKDWLSNPRCSNHLFAAEVALHRALINSEVRTLDPNEADFFFVPVYVSCNFSTINGFPTIGYARPLLQSAVSLISSKTPFWNRSRGADHVFVASHDFGACFHSMEDAAIADGIPSFLKNSIILQTFGVRSNHPCQDVEHILIPPYISPEKVYQTLVNNKASSQSGKRVILTFFRGKMEVHPKIINGRFYSKGVRTSIWHKYSRNRKFYLKRERYDGYQNEIVRSTFCLCPLGWAPWSPRLVESVALGCVPVIIADGILLPYPEVIRWSEISVTVAEKDVNKLAKILRNVASTNLTKIQQNLWDPVNRRTLMFNDMMQDGDATWQVLNELSKKLHRSHRLSRKSTTESETRGSV